VFSFEPGIYLQNRFGVRYENIIHLGREGPESMNLSPRKHFFDA
jgi:Xaa-Pro aminopeptidase